MVAGSTLAWAALPDLLKSTASLLVRQVPVLQDLFWVVKLIYMMEKNRIPVSKKLVGAKPSHGAIITVLKGTSEP